MTSCLEEALSAGLIWSRWPGFQRVPGQKLGLQVEERSEERRVGKECRSLCDWSSDVCSSDLYDKLLGGGSISGAYMVKVARVSESARSKIGAAGGGEIGRASCRERV